jgi:hypothetical protein
MASDTQKIRDQVIEMEQAADDAVAAVEAESGAGQAVKSAVSRLHEKARTAKRVVEEGGDEASLTALLEEAERAADEARDAAEEDSNLGEGARAVIQEAHDATKEARDAL